MESIYFQRCLFPVSTAVKPSCCSLSKGNVCQPSFNRIGLPHPGQRSNCRFYAVVQNWSSSQKEHQLARRLGSFAVSAQLECDTVDGKVVQFADEEDFVKAGGQEYDLVLLQASKNLDQPKIGTTLKKLDPSERVFDVIIVGCGPAGLSLAAETAKRGLSVGLIGPDLPFVNNYGVWVDEFADIGLEHCLDHTWRDASLYIDGNEPILVGRRYGRVSRHLLRQELLDRCSSHGVQYLDSEVTEISDSAQNASLVKCSSGDLVQCRLVSIAAGAASGKFLEYEREGKGVGVQTAYGIEVEVTSYPYDPTVMHFMDYRDVGVGSSSPQFDSVPTFLYAMPLSPNTVFFEETCLAARPAMPFQVLKERLHLRLQSLGVTYTKLIEEEWSYIPVGGALPCTRQRHIGFGAAASMVHPATGYSIARSLREAPQFAEAIASALSNSRSASLVAATQAWGSLWPPEKKRQRAFMIFGLELILQLDLVATREFFDTFFRLPEGMWKGFLSSSLSSGDLLLFALTTFAIAPNNLRFQLLRHLVKDPSGASLVKAYLGLEESLQ